MSPKIDSKSCQFIEAVKHHSGQATTTQIREYTGLSQNEVKYRFKKLKEADFIEIEKPEKTPGERTLPKVAILTEDGLRYAQSNEFKKDENDNSELPEFIPNKSKDSDTVQKVSELEERVEHLEELLGKVLATHPNLPEYDVQ